MASSHSFYTKLVCDFPAKMINLFRFSDWPRWKLLLSWQRIYSDAAPMCLVSLTAAAQDSYFILCSAFSELPSAVLQPVSLQGSCFICGKAAADAAASPDGSKQSWWSYFLWKFCLNLSAFLPKATAFKLVSGSLSPSPALIDRFCVMSVHTKCTHAICSQTFNRLCHLRWGPGRFFKGLEVPLACRLCSLAVCARLTGTGP